VFSSLTPSPHVSAAVQNYMIPLKQVFTVHEMEAIFVNLEVSEE
jgi:hypothetical protein